MGRNNFSLVDATFTNNSAYYGGSLFITADVSTGVVMQRLDFSAADFATRGNLSRKTYMS